MAPPPPVTSTLPAWSRSALRRSEDSQIWSTVRIPLVRFWPAPSERRATARTSEAQVFAAAPRWSRDEVSGPRVSIVIVSWNVRELLRDCLRSIGDETRRRHEIIVVDNDSQDGSAAMVRAAFPRVKLIANRDNHGFAGANNQGMAVATGRHVLLLNPDTLVLDGAIDTMLDWLERHRRRRLRRLPGARDRDRRATDLLPRPRALEPAARRTALRRLPASRPRYTGWDRRRERNVDVGLGMLMLLPRRVVDKVGRWTTPSSYYSEEADSCRGPRRGVPLSFTPVARIRHREGGGRAPPR